jgi:diguanylate cyclase (GGDEF)-like protein
MEASLSRDLYRTAMRDGLTSAYNRRAFDLRLQSEIQEATLSGRPLGLLIFDVDFFKQLNDRWGHPAGDEALCEVADRLRLSLRRRDFFARYGGEEFAVIVRDATLAVALEVAERCRLAVESQRFVVGQEITDITVSVGVSCLTDITDEDGAASRILANADRALYRSKHEGRNRVSVYTNNLADEMA